MPCFIYPLWIAAICLLSVGSDFCYSETLYNPAKSATIISPRPKDQVLFVRQKPSFKAPAIGDIRIGTPVNVIAETKKQQHMPWYKITLPNSHKAAWINGRYVRFDTISATLDSPSGHSVNSDQQNRTKTTDPNPAQSQLAQNTVSNHTTSPANQPPEPTSSVSESESNNLPDSELTEEMPSVLTNIVSPDMIAESPESPEKNVSKSTVSDDKSITVQPETKTVTRHIPIVDGNGNPTNFYTLVTEEIPASEKTFLPFDTSYTHLVTETSSDFSASNRVSDTSAALSSPSSAQSSSKTLSRDSSASVAKNNEHNKPIFLDFQSNPRSVTINKKPLTLHASPSANADTLSTFYPGQTLTITGAAKMNDPKQPHPWYRVENPNTKAGWVYGEDITVDLSQYDRTVFASDHTAPSQSVQQNGAQSSVSRTSPDTQPINQQIIVPSSQLQPSVLPKNSSNNPSTVSKLAQNTKKTAIQTETTAKHSDATPSTPQSGILTSIELYNPPRQAHLTGSLIILRAMYTDNSPPIGYIQENALPKQVTLVARWHGKEPYHWFQMEDQNKLVWVYGQYVRLHDDAHDSPIHRLIQDIDQQYGLSVENISNRLGKPKSYTQQAGQLNPLNTNYISSQLQYNGLKLRFLRYFEVERLMEIEVTDPIYALGSVKIGMTKADIIKMFGEGKHKKHKHSETLTYLDPATERSRITFTFNQKTILTRIQKIAWID